MRVSFAIPAGLILLGVGAVRADLPKAAPVDTKRIDAIFAAWDKPDSPGCAVAVIQDGKIVFEHGYGMADLELGVPITPETVFYVGSDSKQFTAMCIALLVERGLISPGDDVRKYIPELPDYGTPITIDHLLHHTSGIRDYLTLRDLSGIPGDAPFNNDDILPLLARQKELNFKPGSEYLYCNSGYFLLSMIVRQVSGKPLKQFAQENIFTPLGMATASFRDDHTAVIRNRASAYVLRRNEYHLSLTNGDADGAGGLFLTVRDFLQWDRNFYDGKVGGKAARDLMLTRGKLNDGTVLPYAWGLELGTYGGRAIVEHTGSYGGYKADLLRFPDQRFSVACFCNLGSMDPSGLARRVADLYLPEPGPIAEAAPAAAPGARAPRTGAGSPPLALTPDKMLEYDGNYFSEELGVVYRIAVEGGGVTLRGGSRPGAAILVPAQPDIFSNGPSERITFQRDDSGRVISLTVEAGRVKNIRFVRR